MTPRPLTDERLAASVDAHLPVPHAALRERIRVEITTTPQERRLPSILGRISDADQVARRRTMLLVAVVALALAASAVATAGAMLQEQRIPDVPLDPPAVLPDVGEIVHGWPDTSENAAGLYSWDMSSCSSAYCTMGFMHNGYGSGDVEITIQHLVPGDATDDGATAVTVAGHDGTYRQVDGLEQWTFVIDGQTIAIRLEARPGTSQADLADAHAIVASMRTEPHDNHLGFRLVFRLGTSVWDSG